MLRKVRLKSFPLLIQFNLLFVLCIPLLCHYWVECLDTTTESNVRRPTVTIAYSAGNSNTIRHNYKCPEQFGYYPDVNDCTKYFVCVFGDALHESCTGGLYFSSELQTCDWPRNVQCHNTKQNVDDDFGISDVLLDNDNDDDSDDTGDSGDVIYESDDNENVNDDNNKEEKLLNAREKSGDTIEDVINNKFNGHIPESPNFRPSPSQELLMKQRKDATSDRQRSKQQLSAVNKPLNKPLNNNQIASNNGLIGRSVTGSRSSLHVIDTTPVTDEPIISKNRGHNNHNNKINVEIDLKQPMFDEAIAPIIDETGGIHVHDGPGGTYSLPQKNSVNAFLTENNDNREDKDSAMNEKKEIRFINNLNKYDNSDFDDVPKDPKKQYIPVIMIDKEDVMTNDKDNEVKRFHRSHNLRTGPSSNHQNQRYQYQQNFRHDLGQGNGQTQGGSLSSPVAVNNHNTRYQVNTPVDPNNDLRGFVTPRNGGGRIIAIPIFKDKRPDGTGNSGNGNQRKKRVRIVSRVIPRPPTLLQHDSRQRTSIESGHYFTESPPVLRHNPSPLPRIFIPNVKNWFPNLPFYGPSLTQISRVKILPPIGPLPDGNSYDVLRLTTERPFIEERYETTNTNNGNQNEPNDRSDHWIREEPISGVSESHYETPRTDVSQQNFKLKHKENNNPQNIRPSVLSENRKNEWKPIVAEVRDGNLQSLPMKRQSNTNVNSDQSSGNRSRLRNRKRQKSPKSSITTTAAPVIEIISDNYDDRHSNPLIPNSDSGRSSVEIPKEPRKRYNLQRDGRRVESDSPISTGGPHPSRVNAYDYLDYPYLDENGHVNNVSFGNNNQQLSPSPSSTHSPPITFVSSEKPRMRTQKKKSQNRMIASSARAFRYDPIYPTPVPLSAATKCSASKCRIPDCYCGGVSIPGDYKSSMVPQMVMLTFDDSVNDLNWEIYEEIFTDRKNPNQCPILGTFYVSHEWTDYGQVQTLYSRGHEMASHSITHSFGEKFSKSKWHKEIHGQREILHLYGGVHMYDVRGMRAPFLQGGGNKQFEMLYEANFTYDSSMPVFENSPPFWPYTLDYSINHECMITPCPSRSFPGVWEVGMVMWQDLRGGRCSMGDACSNPNDDDGVYEMLMKNFNRHYKSNRAPFGLYYHSAWFNTQHHRKGFIKFLDEILSHDDVYLVTKWQLIQWMREPTPLTNIKDFQQWGCNFEDRTPPCVHPTVCNVGSKSGSRFFKTCQPCPSAYPWVGNTGFVENSQKR